jgi:hypothetical protein
MGGAYPITSASPDVLFYNPALVRNARGMQLSQQRYGGSSSLTQFVASSTANITAGVQILDFGVNGIMIGDQSLAIPVRSTNRASQVEGVIGYARTIKGLRLGGAAKWVEDYRFGAHTGGASFDVGAYANPADFLSVSLVGENLGEDGDGASFDLPRRIQLGLATDSHELGPLDVMMSGEVHDVKDGKVGGGLGAELSYWPFGGLTFYARGGVRMGTTKLHIVVPDRSLTEVKQQPVTAGGGVSYKRMTFEYAWEPFFGAPDAHRFGLHIN